jgi:hypothetical protein
VEKIPACTREYYPNQGGEMADTYESDGAPGDKDGTGMSAVTGNTEEGDYPNVEALRGLGPYPHSPADPDCEGPPLASTDGGPNYTSGQGGPAQPATMPNDRVNSGVTNAGAAMGGSSYSSHSTPRPRGY